MDAVGSPVITDITATSVSSPSPVPLYTIQVVQLGDIIDGCNSKLKESEKALKAVLEVLSRSVVPRYDLIGNHELYNLHRPELERCGLRCGPSGGSSAIGVLDVFQERNFTD